MVRRFAGVVCALSILVLACFARLAADPSALIVDADRPSLDHARPLDDASPGNDLTRLFLPHHLAIARTIARTGHLPLWDDRGFGGRPLVGNPQAGVFYPPAWLAWWINSPASLGWITIGHLLFAGLGTYRLARTLRMGEWGSLVAAGCVQASPFVLAQTFEGHYPHVWSACWSPWAFDAAIRIRRGDLRHGPVLAMILAASMLAGHPQESYYLLIALGCPVIREGFGLIRAGRRPEATRSGIIWLGIAVLTLGLVGIEWLPDTLAQQWTLRGAKLSARVASRYHVAPINLIQLISPDALGGPADYFGHENYWESVTSPGLVPLGLAIIGATLSRDRRIVRGWLLLVFGSFWFALGHRFGLFSVLFELIPGMGRFRVPSRALFLTSLGASMLAGMGVEALRDRTIPDRVWNRLARSFVLATALLILIVLAGRGLADRKNVTAALFDHPTITLHDRASGIRPQARATEFDRLLLGLARVAGNPLFWWSVVAVPVGLSVAARRPALRGRIAVALGILGLIELGIHGHALIRTTPSARILGPDPISEFLEDQDQGSPRIRCVDTLYDDLRAARSGIPKTNVNDSFQIRHAADLYTTLYHLFDPDLFNRGESMDQAVADYRADVRRTVLDRMAVSWLINDRVDPMIPGPLVASGTWNSSTFAVHRNESALPRAYVVPRAELAIDDRTLVSQFRNVDPRQAVLMTTDPLVKDQNPRQPFTPAEWTSTDPDRVVLRVATEAPGLLVVADTWMPGWTATVDGKSLPVLRGNHAQRVVPLPVPGRHEIILTYRTPGLEIGRAITIASIGLGLAWLAASQVAIRRRNRSRATAATMITPMITS